MAQTQMTSLSAGSLIRDLLMADGRISHAVTKVFPVVTDTATLPYIAYRRKGMVPDVWKGGNADTVSVELMVMAETYEASISLAEDVRRVLDGRQGESGGLRMRSCTLADAEEMWQDDAFVQRLVFNIKI